MSYYFIIILFFYTLTIYNNFYKDSSKFNKNKLLLYNEKNIKKIIIDPGHGGKDPGAILGRLLEKSINLQFSLVLGQEISKMLPYAKIVYTRNSDKYITLQQRINIANYNNADLFISIHCNYHKNKTINGIEIFILKPYNDFFDLNYYYNISYQDYSVIMENIILKSKHINNSITLSYFIQKELIKNDIHIRGIKQANFMVIKSVKMASILIEIGFLSNDNDINYINSLKGQKEIAKCISRALNIYNNIS